MPPQVPQTPPGYIPPIDVYIGVGLSFLLMFAILLLAFVIYDKIIAPRKARQKKIQKARWEILEREAEHRKRQAELRERDAFERELRDILSVDYREFRI